MHPWTASSAAWIACESPIGSAAGAVVCATAPPCVISIIDTAAAAVVLTRIVFMSGLLAARSNASQIGVPACGCIAGTFGFANGQARSGPAIQLGRGRRTVARAGIGGWWIPSSRNWDARDNDLWPNAEVTRARKALEGSPRDLNERIVEKIEEAELDPDQAALLDKLLGKDYEVITADERLDKIAADFVEHCAKRWESGKFPVCVHRQDHLRPDAPDDRPALAAKGCRSQGGGRCQASRSGCRC